MYRYTMGSFSCNLQSAFDSIGVTHSKKKIVQTDF